MGFKNEFVKERAIKTVQEIPDQAIRNDAGLEAARAITTAINEVTSDGQYENMSEATGFNSVETIEFIDLCDMGCPSQMISAAAHLNGIPVTG